MSRGPIRELDTAVVGARLEDVRRRTRELVSVLDPETLRRQHTPILSPMIWDLGHIASFEESWLCRELGAATALRADLDRMFDAVANPRPTRESLPLPTGRELDEYLDAVRRNALEILDRAEFSRADPALLRNGLVYELVAEHEEQHQETLLQAMQLLDDPPYRPLRRRPPPETVPAEPAMIRVEGGPCTVGFSGDEFAYDNEKERHPVEVDTFWIDRYPVTAGEFLEFVEEGGYRRREWWSDAGWAWRTETGAEHPGNWRRSEGVWRVRQMDRETELVESRPVAHVCYHEAEAYCRFAGKRLPTELEWEKAALWDPAHGRARRYPWGDEFPTAERANLDQLAYGPARIGSYPTGASAYGVEQLIGDLWEWTASDFTAYPGFRAFPYAEYSEIFFGPDYKLLRGGSWATRPAVARGTFRNWDFPIRRQIFAGFRGARDQE